MKKQAGIRLTREPLGFRELLGQLLVCYSYMWECSRQIFQKAGARTGMTEGYLISRERRVWGGITARQSQGGRKGWWEWACEKERGGVRLGGQVEGCWRALCDWVLGLYLD